MNTIIEQSNELDLTESDQKRAVDLANAIKQKPAPRTTKRVVSFFAAGAIAAAALVAVGVIPKAAQHDALAQTAKAVGDARRAVKIATPTVDGAAYDLRLPGSTAPLQSTVIYARTNGYLKSFKVDIGDRITASQLLAEIESPETDAQLNESRATLERSKADLALVNTRLTRVKSMFQQQSASQGELDDLSAEYNAAIAAVRASEAVVSRLETEQSFQKVVAPFDGVVTQRNIELGSLVTSGSANSVTPLFRIEQNNTLKVFIDVPQSAAPSVTVGQTVKVDIREFPGRVFEGKVVRTAGTVDAATRTLKTEVQLPNPNGELLSGVYTQVHLGVRDPRQPMRIAAAALVVDSTGTGVVTVDANNIAHRQLVTLGRDFGKELEVTGGLTGTEKLVVNPRDDLKTGDTVEIR